MGPAQHSPAHTDGGREVAEAAFLRLVSDPAARRAPFPVLREIRDAAPVFESAVGGWVLTRHEDCHQVLRDPRCGKDWAGWMEQAGIGDWRGHPSLAWGEHSLLFANPPAHTRLRRLVAKAFTPRTVERLRGPMTDVVDALLDPLAEAGGGNLLDALCFPLPVTVIGDVLGVPEGDRGPFRDAVRAATRTLELGFTPEELEAADRATAWMQGYFRHLLAEKRRAPADDMLSRMADAEENGERLSDAEIVEMALLLFAAGFETTTNLIGNGVHHLMAHPDQLRRLRGSADLLPNAVEELLRFDGPILMTDRTAFEDIDVAGRRIPAGSGIAVVLGAGNRDPARYEDPDRLDVAREAVEPLSFGSGIHFCLGASLARTEAAVALSRLLARFPVLEPAGEARFRDQLVFRGLEALPVRCAAG